MNYQHRELANGKWRNMSINSQMANIDSEVSRALKWQNKNQRRTENSFDRALELIDLSIQNTSQAGSLRELCRAREELCDYFIGENDFKTTPGILMRYYNQFVI